MTSVLGLVFLVIIAIIGKYIIAHIHIKRIGFGFLVYSGFYYLILGVVSKPNILNILDLSVVGKSEFFFNFVLGWTGFLVGLQLHFKGIKRFPGKYFTISLIHFLISFLIMTTALFFFVKLGWVQIPLLYIFLLSIVGSMGSVLGVGLLVKQRSIRSTNAHFLQFTTAFDNVLGIIFLGMLFFVYQLTHLEPKHALLVNGVAYFLVILLAFFYKYLDNEFKTAEEESLLVIGLILIVVGMARYLHNSILFLTFLLGALIINMKVDTKKILMTVQEWEKPLNFILLFAIGLYLDFDILSKGVLFLVFLGSMGLAKYLAGAFNRKFQKASPNEASTNNYVLYGMSSLSLAMVLDAYFTNHSHPLLNVLTLIVLSYYLTNALILFLMNRKNIEI